MQRERLSLPEEFSLLAVGQKSGEFKRRMFQAVEFYTVASCMMELFYRGILVEKDGKLMLVESKKTGLKFLDVIIDVLSKEDKYKSLQHWLMNLSTREVGARHHVTDHLVRKKLLKPVKRRVLYFLSVEGFVEAKPNVRKEILEKMREKILGSTSVDEQTLGLVLLMNQAGILKHSFTKQEVSKIEDTIKRLRDRGTENISLQLAKTINSAYKTLGATKWESLGI